MIAGAEVRPMADMSRRRFLTGSAALAGGATVASITACTAETDDGPDASGRGTRSTAGAFDPGDWGSVRDQFPLTHELSHFAAFVLAAHPAPVADAIDRHRKGLDQDAHGYLTEHEVDNEIAVRAAAAEYLDVASGEVALTDSTTMGLGLLYGGLRLRADQEVVTTEHDFYSTHEALRLRSDRGYRRWVARPQCRPRRRRPRTAVRRRRARAGRGERDGCRAGLRLPGGRHPQVAVRAPGHRHRLGTRGGVAGRRRRDPALRTGQLRRVGGGQSAHRTGTRTHGYPGWLPQLRTPLGTGRGVPVPSRHRQGGHRRADA